MAKYCSVKKNEDIQTIKEYCKAFDLTYAQAGSPKTIKELADNLGTTVADLRNPLGGHTSLTLKKNASGKSWMISVDKEYYSQSRESALKSKGFSDAGGGGGSYEFEISGKSRSEVKDIISQVFGSDSSDISIIDIGRFNVAKKNSVSDAERKVKEQSDWKSKADEIIAGVVKDFRMDENDEKELREKLGIKKSAAPRKFCSKKSA